MIRTLIPRKRDANYTQGLNRCRNTTSDAFFHCMFVGEDKQAKGKDTIDWVEEEVLVIYVWASTTKM